jgi:hypothetical protein
MDITEARAVVKTLAQGVDPTTGEVFPPDSPYNEPRIIRALFKVIEHAWPPGRSKLSLDERRQRNTERGMPRNAGLPWSEDDRYETVTPYCVVDVIPSRVAPAAWDVELEGCDDTHAWMTIGDRYFAAVRDAGSYSRQSVVVLDAPAAWSGAGSLLVSLAVPLATEARSWAAQNEVPMSRCPNEDGLQEALEDMRRRQWALEDATSRVMRLLTQAARSYQRGDR